jgi:hypothetical protein
MASEVTVLGEVEERLRSVQVPLALSDDESSNPLEELAPFTLTAALGEAVCLLAGEFDQLRREVEALRSG